MFARYLFAAVVLLTSLCSNAKAQNDQFPSFEAAASAAKDESREIPAAAQSPVKKRRPAPTGEAPSNPARSGRAATAKARQSASAERKIDPNARPVKPKVGQPDVLKAYALTKTAESEEAYNEIIELCKSGMQKGVDTKTAVYARKLSGWAYNRRGESRADAGQTQDAFDDFDAAAGMDAGQWRAFHNRGVSYAMLGNQAAAIEDFGRTLELNPKFANAWFNRGELLYEKRDFAAAVRDYNQALKLAPQDAVAYNSRGHALFRLRRSTEALADYNKALEIDPSSAAAFVNRGDLLADQGNFAEAAKDYRSAININPSLGRAYQSAAWLMATCPEEQFRNAELAIEAAQKAIELDGDTDYRYLETLAAAQANAGEFEDAIGTQQRAIEIAPAAVAQVYKGRIEKFRAGRAHREPAAKLATGSPAASRR